MRPLAVLWVLVLVLACAPAPALQPDRVRSIDAASLTNCKDAFRIWVDGAQALNSADVDLTETLFEQEVVQRRVFELCSLAEAEMYNVEMLWEPAPGISQPLIERDFRTFAEIECVDESPTRRDAPLRRSGLLDRLLGPSTGVIGARFATRASACGRRPGRSAARRSSTGASVRLARPRARLGPWNQGDGPSLATTRSATCPSTGSS